MLSLIFPTCRTFTLILAGLYVSIRFQVQQQSAGAHGGRAGSKGAAQRLPVTQHRDPVPGLGLRAEAHLTFDNKSSFGREI